MYSTSGRELWICLQEIICINTVVPYHRSILRVSEWSLRRRWKGLSHVSVCICTIGKNAIITFISCCFYLQFLSSYFPPVFLSYTHTPSSHSRGLHFNRAQLSCAAVIAELSGEIISRSLVLLLISLHAFLLLKTDVFKRRLNFLVLQHYRTGVVWECGISKARLSPEWFCVIKWQARREEMKRIWIMIKVCRQHRTATGWFPTCFPLGMNCINAGDSQNFHSQDPNLFNLNTCKFNNNPWSEWCLLVPPRCAIVQSRQRNTEQQQFYISCPLTNSFSPHTFSHFLHSWSEFPYHQWECPFNTVKPSFYF